MDHFRLFNQRYFVNQRQSEVRRRPQTNSKLHRTAIPSFDCTAVMFPECFSLKNTTSTTCLPNRNHTVFSSNATKRMFQRLAGSRANTAQPHSRNSRGMTSSSGYRKCHDDDLQETAEQPLYQNLAEPSRQVLLALPHILLSTILANGLLFKNDTAPKVYLGRSCSAAVKECFARRKWLLIQQNYKALSTVSLYWGARRSSKVKAISTEHRAEVFDLASRSLLSSQFEGVESVLMPSSLQRTAVVKDAHQSSFLDAFIRSIYLCDEKPVLQNHLPDSSYLLNFRLLLESLSATGKPTVNSRYFLYQNGEPQSSFLRRLLDISSDRLLVRYCGVHQQFQRLTVLQKGQKTLVEVLKRVRKNQPLIFQELPQPLIRDVYSFEISSYLLVCLAGSAVRAYVYGQHILRMKPTSSSKYHPRSTDPSKLMELRLNEAICYIEREDYKQITTNIETVCSSIVRATYKKYNPLKQLLAFELFELEFSLLEDMGVLLLRISDRPNMQFKSPKLFSFQHQLMENVVELSVDPIFRPPQGQQLVHQMNNFRLVFDSHIQQ